MIPRIGIMGNHPNWDHFRQGLRDNGYMIGQNVAVENRVAQDNPDRLRRAALELAALPGNVFVTFGSPATRAARQATPPNPLIMIRIGGPVPAGFVSTPAHPTGNITGNSQLGADPPCT